jgi:hypothetical protein
MGCQSGRVGWGSTCAAAQHALPVLDLTAVASGGAGDGRVDQAKEMVVVRGDDVGTTDMEALARARDAAGAMRLPPVRASGARHAAFVLDSIVQGKRTGL